MQPRVAPPTSALALREGIRVELQAPVAVDVPQLTLRAVVSGMAFGAILSLCNIYTGLKIGWGSNMSIAAALLSFGFWKVGQRFGARPYGILENNINQTAASAGASISSAGLVAPIPALAMITGQTLSWPLLSLWVFSVAIVGVAVAVSLRRQMLEVDKLPFPFGIATAETLREMYAKGKEAMARLYMLLSAAAVASVLKVVKEVLKLPKFGPNGSIPLGGAAAAKGAKVATLKNLGFAFDPGLLMVGVGALVGPRAATSMMVGAIAAWGIIAPRVLTLGWAPPGKLNADAGWFGATVKWFLWPGVAMMVAAALTSVLLSAPQIIAGLRSAAAASRGEKASRPHEMPRRTAAIGLAAVLVLSVTLQFALFGISAWVGVLAVLLTFALAVVAARVAGETGITPVGAMGKVTQLTFGAVDPGNVTSNLMAANVTGGAASQCADMLHDMKTGLILGAWSRHQATAQVFGVLAGAVAGCGAYLVLVPDPQAMLLTSDWPAPAVAQWKAVAELFRDGIGTMPPGSLVAMAWAGGAGAVLAAVERLAPKGISRWVPSPSAIGLAFIIPAYISVMMFIGGVASVVLKRVAKTWTERFLIVAAAGLVAGESLTGIAFAVKKIFEG